ncbi:MAG: asparagine synthase (glutamine-hydrolyzing), partial [Planctomycetes bacterium]|nr:asparagine synthase (glutamine-hydrolyzing) [Planctomycetota bacterium]
MCGICGAVADGQKLTVDRGLLDAMTSVLRHRGPDDVGRWLGELGRVRVGLGHTRLSIIDLGGGHQPMPNEDESLWIVFNGEIYNFLELRPGLERKGHVFKTRSDTEVILHLYEDKGVDCLADLRGMFAFALWDQRRGRLFLARDRLGVKPLCFHHRPGVFLFASELKALLQVPGFPRSVNREAIHHYLTYQYVPYPLTIFREAEKLPPAHYLLYENDTVQVRRYWEVDPTARPDMTEAEWCERLRQELAEATKLRLIADVPLGAFLSGGMDSSITVGLMSQAAREPVKTFSIGFEEKRYDELDYARLVAKRFQTDHHEFIVRPDIADILPKLVWHYDEPFADSSAIPTYYLSKVTREHV